MTARSLETARIQVAASASTRVVSHLSEIELRQSLYRVRFASSLEDRLSAFRLRFEVFNLELNEGLESAYQIGHDVDEFDPICDHLIVEHASTGRVVGTYRLQTGEAAQRNCGYYSEREFDFAPYEKLRPSLIELGRACIHRAHRSTEVLYLLWRGIAQYALLHGARFLIGCSSLTSQDPAEGITVFDELFNYLVEPALRTHPQVEFVIPGDSGQQTGGKVPKLLRTYLAIGARICGPPALDRQFKTIDFLTLLDLQALHPRVRTRFLR
jgi:putative hemolysin